ncbi:cellulose biosynthesis cyclic di-GMP-binding regulatory protein BcsB [Paenibacillus agricola]|uniref:Cellulose biosynthesis cyclic di-GMP-binding regulatory protein BcsB n=1 Tax=Paenibacillus agricola TaxID=2716264 RepID=A0ABX0J7H9_9BACL|nr:cellulose biosynthesis cyclic di-GMP-binding regulatory protein BcsB [Paenibacillus agricola]NHN30024.1 cellulose biosynthesis cyclic di-GMP-binding regulatory protein BcsB [Paenibacillus agricola]
MKQYMRACASILIVTFVIACVNIPVIYGVAPVQPDAATSSPIIAVPEGNITPAAPINNAVPAPAGTVASPVSTVALPPSAPAASSAALTNVTLAKNAEIFPLYLNDRMIQGENSREDYFFEVAKSRKVLPGSYIDIYFGHSLMLLPKTSTLTVLMDDVPIGAIFLNETNHEKTLLRIDISNYLASPGFHKLSFQAHMEFANNVCMDPNNAANWMVVYKESTIHLNLDKSYDSADLTWYPSPFFEKGSQQPLQSIIVVPDDIEQTEFVAAARLVQFFTSQAQSTRINVPIFAESDLTDVMLANNHTIWLGRTGHWKERGKLVEDTYRKQADPAIQAQGLIAIGASPWNAALSGMVISGTNEELLSALTILTEETLYTQLQGKSTGIMPGLKKTEIQPLVNPGKVNTISFEQMGYNHINIGGRVDVNTTINYNLPNYLDVEDGAKLTLGFKHSKSIEYGQSVLTVKLNGVPVDSHKLSEATSDSGLIEVNLTQDVIGNSRTLALEISVHFANSSPEQNQGCIDPNLIGNWVVIDKASTISYTPVDRKAFNLQAIPYSFIKNGHWNDVTFLLPDKFSSKELNTAMTLIGILGRNAVDTTSLTLTKTSAAGLKDLLRGRNIIYLGTAKDLPDFMNGFPDSSVVFKDNKMTSNTKNIELLSELQSSSALIQLSKSPLNENKTLLVLAATSADRQNSLSEALTDPIVNDKITGKFVVIDNLNKIHAFPEEPAPPKVLAKPKVNQVSDFLNGQNKLALDGSIFVIIFLAVGMLVVSIIWIARKRKRG